MRKFRVCRTIATYDLYVVMDYGLTILTHESDPVYYKFINMFKLNEV